jgi:hypothetical protein
LLSSVACSQPAAQHGVRAAAGEGDKTVQSESNGGGVSGLPFSQGQSFATLDAYLAFLKKRGAYDVPWYREVRPGVYELVSRRGPGAQPQTYTREELEKKFGFSS